MNEVSIVIPAHGHPGMTSACVRAVRRTLPTQAATDITVIDDCSPEPLEAIPGATLVRSDESLGFAGACNLGAATVRSPWILFLNTDTAPQAGWLEAMLACAAEDDRIGIVGSRLTYTDGSIQHAGVVFSVEDGRPRHVYRGFPADHPAVTGCRDLQAVTAACMLVRRSAFEALGGFDTGYRNGFEDVDLCLRTRAAGYRVRYCGAARVEHLESVSRAAPPGARDDPNEARFRERWPDVQRDELDVYVADGLIRLHADDVYPLRIDVDPQVATSTTTAPEIARLLTVRSRQVFDLNKELGILHAQLRDAGGDA